MTRRLTWVVSLAAAIVVTVLHAGSVQATPAGGFTGTTLALGRFGKIDVFNHFLPPNTPALPRPLLRGRSCLSHRRERYFPDVAREGCAPRRQRAWGVRPGTGRARRAWRG